MCGLFGVASQLKNIEALKERAVSARDSLTHRGPDQAGEWHDDTVFIGHRRLSILDLSEAGRQPMCNDDGSVIIAVNGEIYNFQTLREELIAAGAVFKSGSDSEIVLHGYSIWGIDKLLEKIDGMYAFVIYDVKQNKLHLGRDRVGIKPLYYAVLDGQLVWASELKAIVTYFGKEHLATDNTALYDFLTYSYIPAPKTAYQGVRKLEPASILTYDVLRNATDVKRYWHLPTALSHKSNEQIKHELPKLLQKSVTEQLVSDVPIGLFLSGGIDSSIITGLAARAHEKPHTYTIGFGQDGFDETAFAAEVAKHFTTQHIAKQITPELDRDFADWLLEIYDEPIATSSALPTWYVSKFAKENATVVLAGDGGDELFGGYKWYQASDLKLHFYRLLGLLPKFIWKLPLPRRAGLKKYAAMGKKAGSVLGLYNDLYFTKISAAERASLRQRFGIEAEYDDLWFYRQFYKPELGRKRWRQYLDFHCFMPEMVLVKVDRASMQHALEVRVPFLSRELVEYAFSLSESFLYKGGELKGGLKWVFSDMLPDSILKRGKQGFSVPWKLWNKKLAGEHGVLQQAVLERFCAEGKLK